MPQHTNAPPPAQSEEHAPLLPQYAFVLQLRAGVDIQQGRIQGRIEHIQSGQSMAFDSLEDLLQFLSRLVAL